MQYFPAGFSLAQEVTVPTFKPLVFSLLRSIALSSYLSPGTCQADFLVLLGNADETLLEYPLDGFLRRSL